MIGRVGLLLLLVLLSVATAAVGAVEKEAGPERMLLVHVTSLLDDSADRTGLVFRVIATGLRKGYRVVLLLDAEGAGSLKMGRWFGGHSTPLDRAPIAPNERERLGMLLETTAEGLPDIYGSLMHFLRGRGVAIYVNKRALELRGIGDEQYDHAAEAVTEEQIVDLLATTAVYVAY